LKHLIASQSLPFGIHGSDFQPDRIPAIPQWQALGGFDREKGGSQYRGKNDCKKEALRQEQTGDCHWSSDLGLEHVANDAD
jgi:hypothetical protein